MSALAEIKNTALSTMSEDELIDVLTSSLYPGAARNSVRMVLGYCKAGGLDPMLKPVHIVPMWDSKAGQMRDVVMPGVGLYRTQAARTGTFAGQTEPEFGPMVTTKLGGQEITFPEWARVTVKKSMPNGQVAEFTAVEYWIENYAVKGGKEKSIAPNAMWQKRPRGQIAKCAAAQALRLAFPEGGAQPTAEEMEGKSLDEGSDATVIDAGTGEIVQAASPAKPAPLQVWPTDAFNARLPNWKKAIASGKSVEDIVGFASSKGQLTAEQIAAIRSLAAEVLKEAGQRTPEGRTGPAPTFTYDEVAARMHAAATKDALDEAATLIGAVADQEERAHLETIFNDRTAELAN